MKTINNRMNRMISFVALLIFVGFLATTYAYAATYYVNAVSGNDSNSLAQAQNPATPWKTIQKAVNTMVAGDTCMVFPGNYNVRVTISRSGNSSSPITFQASERSKVFTYGFSLSGVKYVIIDGFEITMPLQASWDVWDNGSGVSLINTQYCEVRNNHIYHTLREGIMIYTSGADDSTNSSYNKIIGNKIEYAGAYAGITLNGAAQLIENNDISHTIQHPLYPTLSTAGGPDADGIKFFGKDHIFRGNYIHDITLNDAGNVNPHTDGFQTYGPAYNILFEKNIVNFPNNSGSYQIAMISQIYQPTQDLIFRNNIFTAYRGLNIWGINDWTGEIVPLYRVTIENNTFYGIADYYTELHDCPNSIVKNNATSGRGLWTNSSPQTSNNKVGQSSDYMNAANRDFHLSANSVLKDVGVTLPDVKYDFDNISRPQGSGYDIGAFEYVVNTPPQDNNPPVANDKSISLSEDASLAVTLQANDANGDTLSYSIETHPANGILSGTAPNLTYKSLANYNGTDAFSFKANDGNADSNIATVYITVTPVNDPPATPQNLTAQAGGTDSITLNWLVASDPDNGDIVKYNLYRAATVIASNISATSYTDTGLAPDTSYSYQVEAVDNSGAKSAELSAVNATTQPIPTYTITASAGANGSISPNGAVTVNSGDNKAFTITASANYHIADVLVDGLSQGAIDSYTFSNITANHSITASFAINTYTLSITVANGTVAKSPDKANYNFGDIVTLTATPSTGYSFSSWSGDLAGNTNPQTITMNSNKTVTANLVINTYTITASAGVNGSISPSGATTLNYGQSQTYTITANTGYKIKDVLIDSASQGAVSSYTFSNIQANHTITASFELIPVPPAPVLPVAPTNLAATALSRSKIKVTWVDNASNEAGFKIERATSSTGAFRQIAAVNANTTSYANGWLSRGRTYYYRVRAYNANGNSSYSNTAQATTLRR